jgi:hypothetical protein
VSGHKAAGHEPYHEDSDYSWTEIAFEELGRGELRGEVTARRGVAWSRVWGACPRCRHDLDDEQTHSAITGLGAGGTRGKDDDLPDHLTVDVTCHCAERHAGAPAGASGCGVSFRVELPVRVVPGNGHG